MMSVDSSQSVAIWLKSTLTPICCSWEPICD